VNEKIKLLAEQAGISLSQKDFSYYWVESAEDMEKFAALIIRELIDSMIKRYGDDDELPIEEIKLFAKEHFGVGE
jgi:hypothetical protein